MNLNRFDKVFILYFTSPFDFRNSQTIHYNTVPQWSFVYTFLRLSLYNKIFNPFTKMTPLLKEKTPL